LLLAGKRSRIVSNDNIIITYDTKQFSENYLNYKIVKDGGEAWTNKNWKKLLLWQWRKL
jgi:hypothetical protein